MVFRTWLEHDLVAVASLAFVASCGRGEGAGAHQDSGGGGEDFQTVVPDERGSEIFIRPGCSDGGGDGGVVPEAAAAVHLAGEHSWNIRGWGYRPREQLAGGVAGQG